MNYRDDLIYSIEERLIKNSKVNPETGCLEWQGKLTRLGYGLISFKCKRYSVHRLSAHFFKGFNLDKKISVMHTCDNPKCINPNHLTFGTHQDNINDMMSKNRQAKGSRIGLTKLTPNNVLEIRQLLNTDMMIKDIASKFNVDPKTIRCLRDGITWKHI